MQQKNRIGIQICVLVPVQLLLDALLHAQSFPALRKQDQIFRSASHLDASDGCGSKESSTSHKTRLSSKYSKVVSLN